MKKKIKKKKEEKKIKPTRNGTFSGWTVRSAVIVLCIGKKEDFLTEVEKKHTKKKKKKKKKKMLTKPRFPKRKVSTGELRGLWSVCMHEQNDFES